MVATGRVESFDLAKKFGWLVPLGARRSVFVHQSDVLGNALQAGDAVAFDLAINDAGKQRAVNVSGGTGPPLALGRKPKGKGKGKGDLSGKAAMDSASPAAPKGFAFGPSPNVPDLDAAVRQCRVPRRGWLEAEARRFAKGPAAAVFGEEFSHQPGGSVYAAMLDYAIDLDIIMLTKQPALLLRHADALFELAGRAFLGDPLKVRIVHMDNTEGVELDWSEFRREEVCSVDPLPFVALVVTGMFRTQGRFELPMDITITSGSEKESHEHRIGKIRKKSEEGDYAKVLQKVRALLKANDQLKGIRARLCDALNADVGRLRFVTQQMVGPHSAEYLAQVLGLHGLEDAHVREGWTACATAEMQRRARAILRRVRDELRGNRAQWVPMFLDATSGADSDS